MMVAGPVTKSPTAKTRSEVVLKVSALTVTLPRSILNCRLFSLRPLASVGVVPFSGPVPAVSVIAIEAPEGTSVVGRTTEDQMLIGIYWGYVAMIEGLVARLKAEITATEHGHA